MEQLGNPDVLWLQELRIRQQDEDALRALTRALPGYRCHVSLARDARNVTFRGGRMYGVATDLDRELRRQGDHAAVRIELA